MGDAGNYNLQRLHFTFPTYLGRSVYSLNLMRLRYFRWQQARASPWVAEHQQRLLRGTRENDRKRCSGFLNVMIEYLLSVTFPWNSFLDVRKCWIKYFSFSQIFSASLIFTEKEWKRWIVWSLVMMWEDTGLDWVLWSVLECHQRKWPDVEGGAPVGWRSPHENINRL